jgi:predicted acylesterase/phospholipase RssA
VSGGGPSGGGPSGVVLSGGGANGAYEVGVLQALLKGASPATGFVAIDPEIYTGTSVGAYNAAVMCSRPGVAAAAVADELKAVWLERIADNLGHCGNGVFRVRGAPFQFLDPGCLARPLRSLAEAGRDAAELAAFGLVKGAEFATSRASLQSRLLSLLDLDALISEAPMKQLVAETIDLDRLRRSDKQLTIAATDWEHGLLRLYSREEVVATGTDVILASAALPGIFRPVPIDGVPFVDGGVLLNTPLNPAINCGADTIYVIFLDPLLRNISTPLLPSSLDTFYRLFAVIWAASVRRDVLRIAVVNRLLERLQRVDLDAPAALPGPGLKARELALVLLREVEDRPYRPLTVHVFRPGTDLGGGEGLLDFDQRRLAGLVELGYQDAASHDCATAGCVLAGARAGARAGEGFAAAAGGSARAAAAAAGWHGALP